LPFLRRAFRAGALGFMRPAIRAAIRAAGRRAALALALGCAGAAGLPAQTDPGGPGSPATDPAGIARAAVARLDRAAALMEAAGGGRDRVAALTETVRAYEDGLAALRDGLRRTAIRERAIALELEARTDEMSGLLGVLTTLSAAPAPLLLLHPSGPTGTARSGMILAEATPALQREVEDLRARLQELGTLRAAREEAAARLQAGLGGAQAARSALAAAIAERGDLPRRYTENEAAMEELLASARTLAAFAGELDVARGTPHAAPIPDATERRGRLPLPVLGRVLHGYGETDAAGTPRPGWVIAAEPRALVTAPTAATIRYAGPLLDLGQVVIVEPAPDLLFVLAGLAEVYGTPGEVVPEGTPLGLMGGDIASLQAILTEGGPAQAAPRTETLYVEVRDGQDTVDPGSWFAPGRGRQE